MILFYIFSINHPSKRRLCLTFARKVHLSVPLCVSICLSTLGSFICFHNVSLLGSLVMIKSDFMNEYSLSLR